MRRSHQIDDREERDPDDVERVPEQGEAQDAAQDVGAESLGEDLRHHRQQPEQAGRDMQAVAADQREEGRQEGAARRPGAARDQAGELAQLSARKPAPSTKVTAIATWNQSCCARRPRCSPARR